MKKVVSFVFLCMIIISTVNGQHSVTLDHTDGIKDGYAFADTPINFYIRFTNDNDYRIRGFFNYFRTYLRNNGELPDGEFQLTTIEEVYQICVGFDFCYLYEYSYGYGSDTVGGAGSSLTSNGMSPYFDEVVFKISTMVAPDRAGDTLCIDSSFYPASASWVWYAGTNGNHSPSWSGPHCFEILPTCCIGSRGNVDGGYNEPVDIGDIVYLVVFYFENYDAPPCPFEADVNGDNSQDIGDLVFLVEYMFNAGPEPVACP